MCVCVGGVVIEGSVQGWWNTPTPIQKQEEAGDLSLLSQAKLCAQNTWGIWESGKWCPLKQSVPKEVFILSGLQPLQLTGDTGGFVCGRCPWGHLPQRSSLEQAKSRNIYACFMQLPSYIDYTYLKLLQSVKKRFILGQEFSLSSLSLEMPTSHIKVPGFESQLFSKFHHPANVHLGSETLNPGHSYHWPLNTCFYKFHKYSGILSSVLTERINKHIPKQQRPVCLWEVQKQVEETAS